MTTPYRLPNGVTNRASSDLMGQALSLDSTLTHRYFNDFDTYAAGDWTITDVGANTRALTDADGGALLITNAAAENDGVNMQLVGESFAFATGRKLWFKTRLTLSDATQMDALVGLAVLDTTLIASAPANGVYFRKDDGDTQWDFSIQASSVSVSETSNFGTATTSAVVLGFYFDGVDTFEYYFDGTKIGEVTATGFPTTELSVSLAELNGEAVAKTLTWDYVLSEKER